MRRSDPRSGAAVLATGLLALVAQRQGEIAAGNRWQQDAAAMGLTAADLYFEWARLESLARHRAPALAFLASARAAGLNAPPDSYDDPAFDLLRNDPEFVRLARP